MRTDRFEAAIIESRECETSTATPPHHTPKSKRTGTGFLMLRFTDYKIVAPTKRSNAPLYIYTSFMINLNGRVGIISGCFLRMGCSPSFAACLRRLCGRQCQQLRGIDTAPYVKLVRRRRRIALIRRQVGKRPVERSFWRAISQPRP